jgi:hypothetical protein
MLVDEAKAIQLAGAQPLDPLLDSFIGRQAACPPIVVRQAVPILPSDFRPAQHSTNPPSMSPGVTLCHRARMRQNFSGFAGFFY